MNYPAANPEGGDQKERVKEQRDALTAMGYQMYVMTTPEAEEDFQSALEAAKREGKRHETIENDSIKELWVKDRSAAELKASGFTLKVRADKSNDAQWDRFDEALEEAKNGTAKYSTRHTDETAELWVQNS